MNIRTHTQARPFALRVPAAMADAYAWHNRPWGITPSMLTGALLRWLDLTSDQRDRDRVAYDGWRDGQLLTGGRMVMRRWSVPAILAEAFAERFGDSARARSIEGGAALHAPLIAKADRYMNGGEMQGTSSGWPTQWLRQRVFSWADWLESPEQAHERWTRDCQMFKCLCWRIASEGGNYRLSRDEALDRMAIIQRMRDARIIPAGEHNQTMFVCPDCGQHLHIPESLGAHLHHHRDPDRPALRLVGATGTDGGYSSEERL